MKYKGGRGEVVEAIFWNGKNRKAVERWINGCTNVSFVDVIGGYLIIENYGRVVQINPFFYLVRSAGNRKFLKEVVCVQDFEKYYSKEKR